MVEELQRPKPIKFDEDAFLEEVSGLAPNEFVGRFIRKLNRVVPMMFVNVDGRPLKLTYYQLKFVARALTRNPGKYAFIACSRAGKTTSTAVLAILYGILYSGEEVVVVAPTFKQTQILFGRIRTFIQSSPVLMRFVDRSKSFTRETIHFKNGSVLRALSAGNPDALLGWGASVVIVDEAGSIPDNVFTTRIVRMLMAPKTRNRKPVMILLGTPHTNNYLRKIIDSNDFYVVRVSWRDAVRAGVMLFDEVLFARRLLSDVEFRVWFEGEFVDGVSQSGDLFFDLGAVRSCARVSRRRRDGLRLPGCLYVGGLDVARFGDDYSFFVVLEVDRGFSVASGSCRVVSWYWMRRKPLNEVIGWASDVFGRWRLDALGVDDVGMGAAVRDVLAERFGDGVVFGVGGRGSQRRDMYLLLRRLVAEGRVELPSDEFLLKQFESFRVRFRAFGDPAIVKSPGRRDDFVDALAIAVWVAGYGLRSVVSGDVAVLDGFDDWLALDPLLNRRIY